ncbi:MAG TPA: PKD domain-containing protein, partial [Planctomycetota bacterium]|nr:PKD domain-containing protein [Planctomycetota bacterium]
GNSAGASGNGGGICAASALTLINCTVFSNTAHNGGNVFSSGTVNFQNTIIAGGSLLGSGGIGPDISGAGFNSLDYNLIQNATGGVVTGAVAHNITGVSPMLATLADNGGPTRTCALRIGSPALDAGSAVNDPATTMQLATDQRGKPRVVNNPFVTDASGGDGSDIGAFELQPQAPTISIVAGAYAFENGSSGAIPFSIDDADTPLADLNVSASSANTALLPDAGIQLNGSGANRTLIMTPANGQAGDVLVTLSVSDGTFVTKGFILLTVTPPPAITSDAATTLTIGQQCPEIVTIGDNDMIVVVGTPCPFTVTTTGTPAPAIAMGGTLPSGVYFIDNGDGTGTLGGIPAQGTAGNYPLTFTATNEFGSSLTQNFTLKINTPPVISSIPIATPSPALVGQSISLTAAATDADGDTLSYVWNFGEGTNANGPSVSHTYTQPGNYLVFLVVTDPSSAFVYDQVTVTVNGTGGGGGGGGGENQSVVGAGPDSDGDGFSDAFESAVGTDPTSAASTPTGQPITAAELLPLALSTASINLNFARPAGDSIAFAGTLAIPAGFNPSGAKIYFDVGGVAKVLTLGANGSIKSGGDSVKINFRKKNGVVLAQTARYTAKFADGSFATALAAEGLTNTVAKNAPVTVTFTLVLNGSVSQTARNMLYTARTGRTGTAK